MKLKALIILLLTVLLTLTLASCGSDEATVYYTVKFDTNGAEAMQDRIAVGGKTLTKPRDPVKNGYTFIGWFYGEREWNFETDTVTAPMTLKAKFDRISYSVTFDSADGTSVAVQYVNEGAAATRPADISKPGHDFAGWYLGDEPWNFSTPITESITLTAKWTPFPEYTVTFDSDGGSAVAPENVTRGECASEALTEKPDHYFAGWHKDGRLWDFKTPVTENITLTAKWTPYPEYTVTFDSDGGSAVAPETVTMGHTATLPETPEKSEFDFLGWFIGEDEWDFAAPVTENITLTAKWTPYPEYTVTFDSDGGSAVAPETVTKGHTATEPEAPEKARFEFDGWFIGEDEWDFATPVTENITLTAKWTPAPTYTVSFDTSAFAAYDPDYSLSDIEAYIGDKLDEPDDIPTVAPTTDGYMFAGWYNGDEKWDFETDTVTAGMTLTAKLVRAYTVTASHGKDASGNDFGIEDIYYVAEGDTLSPLDAPPYPNPDYASVWQFTGWYIYEDVKWDFSTPITEDVSIYAVWAPMLPIHPF